MLLRRAFVLTVAILIAAIPASLQADLVAYDGFNYTAGSLPGNSGGTGWSNAWSAGQWGSAGVAETGLTYASGGQSLVTSGGAATLTVAGQGAYRTPTSALNSGSVYISFLADRTAANSSYLGLSLFSGSTEKVFIGAGNSETVWGAQIKATETQCNSTVATSATPTLLVTKLDYGPTGAGTLSLYVNPSLTAEPGAASASGSFSSLSWDRIRIQADGFGGIDEIRIGTSYADVTSSVPEPGTLALLATGLFGLLAYAWRKRK
jgi:hypothetical protein